MTERIVIVLLFAASLIGGIYAFDRMMKLDQQRLCEQDQMECPSP